MEVLNTFPAHHFAVGSTHQIILAKLDFQIFFPLILTIWTLTKLMVVGHACELLHQLSH